MGPALRFLRPGLLAAFLCLLGACAPTRAGLEAPEEPAAETPASSEPVDLRVVYVIHGDADYTYHDSTGHRLFADREAVKQAREVGRRAQRTEVFIFHQKPFKTSFFDVAQKAGNYYHYSSGTLLRRTAYRRADNAPYLEAEAAVLRRDADSAKAFTVFVYFGHEIPLTDRAGYSVSYDEKFSRERFAEGVQRLGASLPQAGAGSGKEKPFDLAILSACYGGTPPMLQALAPLATQVIASPAYLHLSYLETRALGDFTLDYARNLARHKDAPYSEQDMRALTDSVAAQSFAHLKSGTQTEITVGIYDTDSLAAFLASTPAPVKTADKGAWKDCAEDPAFNAREAARGVKLFYQPPRFGPLKEKTTRSAWQCLF